MKEVKLQKYPAYKDSGVEWLGEIPEHWEVKRIKFLFKIGRGRVISQQELIENGQYPVYSSQTLNNGVLGYINTYDFDCTQITWTTDGANAGTVFLRRSKHNCTNVCGTLQPNSNEQAIDFVKFALQVAAQFHKRPDTNGAKIMNGEMGEVFITIPPKEEQTAIANFLDNKTALIDKAIALKEKQIELLKERRQILIHRAVTRGLNPDVKLKDSGVEWIGEIPEHWEVKKIKNLGKIVNGFAFNSTDFKSAGVRVMKIANIQTMKVDWSDESFVDQKYFNQYPQFQIKRNDLVFALTRPIISTGIKATIVDSDEPILLNQRNAVLKPCNELNKLWIYYIILNSQFVQAFDNQIDKTGQQPNISTYNIGNLEIPLPSLEEQILISEFLENTSQKISTAITLKEKEIEKLKEYKSVLINEAVSGKIKVG